MAGKGIWLKTFANKVAEKVAAGGVASGIGAASGVATSRLSDSDEAEVQARLDALEKERVMEARQAEWQDAMLDALHALNTPQDSVHLAGELERVRAQEAESRSTNGPRRPEMGK